MGEKPFPAVSHFRARKRHDNKPTTSRRNKKIQKVPSRHSQKIQKVPLLLRKEERNHEAYDPKVVSFGPYHHGKPELQLCEQGKHFAVEIFIKRSNQTREFFFGKILEIIADARNCYIAGSTDNYSDAEFAEMMLLDACFLIYYMGIGVLEPVDHISMYSHLGGLILSWVNRDVLLMENQIPFDIVMLLVNLRYHDGEEKLIRFLHNVVWGQYKEQQIHNIQQLKPWPLHLFEAFRVVQAWDSIPECEVRIEENENNGFKYRRMFRSAKDLKSKGIYFRPSSSKSLKDINFKSFAFYGILQLPTWLVSGVSKVFLLNMIAYELCPNNLVDAIVITNVNFIRTLVDSPDDVKELREKKILLTSLTDVQVVSLFKDLHTYGMADTESFREVQRRVQEHYDSKAKTWMAELIHTYLSSPWSIIAWFAGLLLLILTFMQTYFTINPRN